MFCKPAGKDGSAGNTPMPNAGISPNKASGWMASEYCIASNVRCSSEEGFQRGSCLLEAKNLKSRESDHPATLSA